MAPKRYGEVAVKNRAARRDDRTTEAQLVLADGDAAWNPHGDDFAGPGRVIYQFHEDGPPGVVEIPGELPPVLA